MFWEQLMAEQGVDGFSVVDSGADYIMYEQAPDYNVGDVIVGEIVEEENE